MVSWWWLVTTFGLGFGLAGLISWFREEKRTTKLSDLGISDRDIELSEARLEALYLSKTLQNICSTPDCPDCCTAERWRKDANKWAKKVIRERIEEKLDE